MGGVLSLSTLQGGDIEMIPIIGGLTPHLLRMQAGLWKFLKAQWFCVTLSIYLTVVSKDRAGRSSMPQLWLSLWLLSSLVHHLNVLCIAVTWLSSRICAKRPAVT